MILEKSCVHILFDVEFQFSNLAFLVDFQFLQIFFHDGNTNIDRWKRKAKHYNR